MIRLRKSDALIPTRLPVEMFVGDPPVYRETLRALVGRDPTFMACERVAPQVADWSALDELMAKVNEEMAA